MRIRSRYHGPNVHRYNRMKIRKVRSLSMSRPGRALHRYLVSRGKR